MSDIGWSKAPEGATHWEPASRLWSAGWMRLSGDWYFWGTGSRTWVVCDLDYERTAAFIPRPAAWNGEGLPPVGIVCEYKSGRANGPAQFSQCTIIAHFDGETQRCAAYTHVGHDGVVLVGQGTAAAFRPVRTPEQIAAEEREKARDEVLNRMTEAGAAKEPEHLWQHRLKVVGEMLDMGYRKVEGE